MINQEVLDRALKVAKDAEVFHVQSRDTPALFEANRLKLLKTRETTGIALRIIKNGKIGFASTTNIDNIQGLINAATDIVPFGAEAHLEFPPAHRYPSVDLYDPEIELIPSDEMIHIGQLLIDEIRRVHPKIQCEGRITKGVSTITILNSKGAHISYTKSIFNVSIEGTLVRGSDMLFVGDSQSSCHPIRDTSLVRESIEYQIACGSKIAPSLTGSLPVIFTPHGVAETILGPLLAGFNGRTILQGASPLVNQFGKRIVDDRFSLWDDPTIPYMPGSAMADDEGMPSQRKALIYRGIVSSFLYDLQTAGQAGTTSTGNASRSLMTPPSPAPTVLLIDEGNISYDDMVKDMEDGIVVERLLGAGQGNVLSGDFNANVLLGYRVKRGEIIGRIKDTVISGNSYNVLNNLTAIGNNARWLNGNVKTPAILCSNVSVSAKK
jgi:PmbA protein